MPKLELQPLIPEVVDEDIKWVRRVMDLPTFDQPRQEFLREHTTLDVSACPGSGKTTLIVAKLAIMARKWPHHAKGICVLSHTNAAREEIQHRLRGTVSGQQLLSYPHFIDTIHGFVNRFLALPWLNSNGFPSATIDDDVTSAYRRRAIGEAHYHTLDTFLKRKGSGFDNLRIRDRNLGFDIGKPFPAGPNTLTFRLAKQAIEAAAKAGYFRYDEMFIWANTLLDDCPAVSTFLQHRFPLVVIDEMQDTSELQADILDSVFPRAGSKAILQRVGDPNQAIYDNKGKAPETSASYPDAATCLRIPNSHRFGPSIAALASPFAVEPVGPEGLKGIGPQLTGCAHRHCSNAVFIFPDSSPNNVLDIYGEHVLSYISESCLAKGIVSAVGGVHKDASEVVAGHQHFPKTVPHYWGGYNAEVSRRDPHPRTLIQYVRVAQGLVWNGCDLSPAVEMLASGLVRMARRTGGASLLGRRAARHRTLVETLAQNPRSAAAYRHILRLLLIDLEPLTPDTWRALQAEVLLVAMGLNGHGNAPDPADNFLHWDERERTPEAPASSTENVAGPNVYRVYGEAERHVDIRLGSIHSVKGQSHLATLLLSTYWNGHSAEKMLPWFMGEKVNLNGAGPRDEVRLRQTYVAMTRPSHLLSLAIPRSALGDESVKNKRIATMQRQGWAVAEVVDGSANWYS